MRGFVRSGFSLAEIVVVIAISSILLVALSFFVRRAFDISREQFEQVRITEEARIQLDRIVDSIRNARNVDCDNDGQSSDPNEYWLQAANSNYLAILTNIDNDPDPEKVVYYPEGGELKRVVTQLDSSCAAGSSETFTFTRYLKNESEDTDLFQYYIKSGGQPVLLSQPETALKDVTVINTTLVIDVNEQQYPEAIHLSTATSPRGIGSGLCAVKDSKVFELAYTGIEDFALEAFSECKDYCGGDYTDASGDSTYCPWMGVPVMADAGSPDGLGNKSACLCEPPQVPAGMNGEDNECHLNEMSGFTRRCWGEDDVPNPGDTAFCGTGVKGTVYIDAGGLDPMVAGKCGCMCPEASPLPSSSPSVSPTPSATVTPSATPTVSPTVLPTDTPAVSPSPSSSQAFCPDDSACAGLFEGAVCDNAGMMGGCVLQSSPGCLNDYLVCVEGLGE